MDLLYFLFFPLLISSASFNNVEGLRAHAIVGGALPRRGSFRHVVAIMYKSPGIRDQNPCSGSILSEFFIATVAHCFYDKIFGEWRNKLFYIIAGAYNIKYGPFDEAQSILVDTVTIPKIYEPDIPVDHAVEGNLAIVKVTESLKLDSNDSLITKLDLRKYRIKNLFGRYYVSGFGYHEVIVIQEIIHGEVQNIQRGSSDGHLRYAKAKILDKMDCQHIINDNIARGIFCAKLNRSEANKPVGLCKYDSGAPLSHLSYLDGIAINGFTTCNEEHMPGLYISVQWYYQFIKNVLNGKRHQDMYVMQLQTNGLGEYAFNEI